jgi:hypothetical protein
MAVAVGLLALLLLEAIMVAVALALLLEQVVVAQYELFGLVLQVLPEPSHQQIQVTCKEKSWQYLVKTF